MINRRTFAMATSLAMTVAVAPGLGTAQSADYPTDSLRIIVPFGAGGGTDAVARIIGSRLSERLGITVNVENRAGAGGVVGSQAVADAETDGSVIGIITASLGGYQPLGRSDINYESFAPIAMVNFDPAGVQIAADSEFENLEQLVTALEENPGQYTASASGIGGSWHVAWMTFLQAAELPLDAATFIPSDGASTSLNELLAGAVDIVPSSVPEAAALIEAGDVKSLAVMSSERIEAFPDVPTVEEATGINLNAGLWRGFAGPEGMDEEAVDILVTEIEAIYESEDFKEQMSDLGYGLRWAAKDDFRDFMQETSESMIGVLEASGLAQ
ncbi:tripartite tricarboxylate transporter substrate binding protein [Roseicyclus sp. F158]|uniref:Tripartite tricarboxylate transporter substrate binding protein n=1 Tax=Tropicimonas omnivorans TaxID=3075590 RepID=A0ABU3DLH8_9RHOB|nr:tripartite tricarboxylate transporter substrate binding protein [Roseicyclus sp. F158]MDT0684575.1 tripartite tricarboxylate transporter substrate binding protein [Roseicyclus sp. F158]